MSKLSLKEVAMHIESGAPSKDLAGVDIQDGAFAKLWDEWLQIYKDEAELWGKIAEYLDPYFTHPRLA